MKKILVMVITMVMLTVICGAGSGEEVWTPMEIIIVEWQLDEHGEAKATNVDVVLSTPNACKELTEKDEWFEGCVCLGSLNGQWMRISFRGRTPETGATHGEMWAFPIDQNGEPQRMDLLPFASELEVYYNL